MISIGVIFGSQSVEHEVSIITAVQAINFLDKLDGYNIVPIYIDKKGVWYTGNQLKSIEKYKNMPELLKNSQRVSLIRDGRRAILFELDNRHRGTPKALFERSQTIDIVFPIVHGTYGEDGTLQGYLEMLDLPYVGCDVLSAAITMDKIVCKNVLEKNNIPVIKGFGFSSQNWLKDSESIIDKIQTDFSYPVIVKPANMGSSIGVSVAHNIDELYDAIELCVEFTDRILIEKFVSNLMEINISVLGDCEDIKVSACERPVSSNEFLSYEDKYQRQESKKISSSNHNSNNAGMASLDRILPADISLELQHRIEELARQSFLAVGASGVARLDFIVDKDTDNVYLNELNTIPGSLSFYLWKEVGVSFEDLLQEMIDLALRKYRRTKRLQFSTDTNLLQTANLGGVKK